MPRKKVMTFHLLLTTLRSTGARGTTPCGHLRALACRTQPSHHPSCQRSDHSRASGLVAGSSAHRTIGSFIAPSWSRRSVSRSVPFAQDVSISSSASAAAAADTVVKQAGPVPYQELSIGALWSTTLTSHFV